MSGFKPPGAEGAGFQLFTQLNGTPGVYADAAARDVFFGANPSDLARLDADEFLIIKLLNDGAGAVAYQQRQSSTWVDVTSLVQGDTGPAGATGNSYFFASIAARDAFFNTPPNEGLLESDLPIQVNEGTVSTVYYWTGDTAPISYDADLWRPASVGSSPGTLLLGKDGVSISSAGRSLNLIDAYGQESLPLGVPHDSTGSTNPVTFDISASSVTSIANVFDTELSVSETMLFSPAAASILTDKYVVRPATVGDLRVQAFAGTLETDPVILDTTFAIILADIGTTKTLTLANNILTIVGDDVLVKFSGITLFGGLQVSGAFTGQTVPYLDGDIATVSPRNLSLVGDSEIEIFTAADLDALAIGGIITVASNLTLNFKAPITTDVEFVVSPSQRLTLIRTSGIDVVTYSGSGTFITSSFGSVIIRTPLTASGGGTLIDMEGNQTSLLIVENILMVSWKMGSVRKAPTALAGPLIAMDTISIANFQDSLLVTDLSSITLSRVVLVPFAGVSVPLIDLRSLLPGFSTFVVVAGNLGANESLVRVDPAINEDAGVIVSLVTVAGTLFDTSGSTGTFTAVTDNSFSGEAITSVTDSGGIARFNFTAPPTLFVNQKVTIIGFVTNTGYNVTGTISATGAGFFEIQTIPFGTDEAVGSFSSDSITLTDTATIVIDGDTLVIDTDESLAYDGGYTVYNALTNSFSINAVDVPGIETGSWSQKGLDQSDPRVLASNSPGLSDSTASIEASLLTNTLATDIPAVGAKVLISSNVDWISASEERFKLAHVHEAVYVGNEPETIKLDGNILLEPTISTKNISCQFVRMEEARVIVTFTNGTNIINETGHTLVNGNVITFHNGLGTLPVELRDDIIYYVVGAATNTFQVSYTVGGAAIAFTDDGSGTNTYALADLKGSIPIEPIAAGSARTLVPQSLTRVENGDSIFVVVTNEDDATNILVDTGYYRVAI